MQTWQRCSELVNSAICRPECAIAVHGNSVKEATTKKPRGRSGGYALLCLQRAELWFEYSFLCKQQFVRFLCLRQAQNCFGVNRFYGIYLFNLPVLASFSHAYGGIFIWLELYI